MVWLKKNCKFNISSFQQKEKSNNFIKSNPNTLPTLRRLPNKDEESGENEVNREEINTFEDSKDGEHNDG